MSEPLSALSLSCIAGAVKLALAEPLPDLAGLATEREAELARHLGRVRQTLHHVNNILEAHALDMAAAAPAQPERREAA